MKKTISSAIVALPFILTAPSYAGFEIRMPMEVAGGGVMPNNSIVFKTIIDTDTGSDTTPVTPEEPSTPDEPAVPDEPVAIDPFEPENPDCDPYAQDYPGNVTGKELVWDDGFTNADGTSYRSCKLKDTGDTNLLARYVSGIDAGVSSTADSCNPSASNSAVASGSCRIAFTYFTLPYTVEPNVGGSYNYTNQPVKFLLPSKATFSYDDIGRIEIDGHVCSNLRTYVIATFPVVRYGTDRICDLNASYEDISSKVGQPFLVEIYKK
ncbi:hypothetical protein GR140_19045 [Pseudomonas putida]|uniref:hypothetical protein n=1 Tax=Pseudomonas putida TaxID=303 RepID=UPI001BAFCFD6|nr:hypothetical protein [Pseudomonas putida]QUG90763.1 hypothetical protein GR140_19045 [Pseudomonas putida]